MNDQIKESATQAGATHKLNLGVYQFYEHELEHFIELLLNEVTEYLTKAVEVHSQSEQDLLELAAKKLKEHFGVKE